MPYRPAWSRQDRLPTTGTVIDPSLHMSWNALAATSCPVLLTDATQSDNPITYANAAFSALFGYDMAEIVGRNCRFLQGPDTNPATKAEIRLAIEAGEGIRREILNYCKDGTPFWNDLTIDPIKDAAGRVTGFIGIQHRSDAVHVAMEEKAEAEIRLESIADHIPGYLYRRVMRTDGTVELVYCSPSIGKLLGIEAPDVSRLVYEHVHPDDRAALLAAIRSSAANMSIFREEFRLISSDGTVHWLRSDAPPRRMANGEVFWDGLAIEFSAEKKWESEIANLALRDHLTGLLTRQTWRQAIAMQLCGGVGASRQCGVLYIDIVAFHELNARLGARAGDEILREAAHRLATIAESVAGISARLAGDEFALLVPGCTGNDALSLLAQSSGEILGHPIGVDGESIAISTCIGGTVYSYSEINDASDTDIASELNAQAELALRLAKQEGSGSLVLYTPERDDRFQNQAILARSLKNAIESDQLELHYQPLVDLASGRVVAAEALVRWKHPTLGMQRPDLFIPMAEKQGLIVPLGRWVLEQALRQHKAWHDAGLSPPPISINVSGNQLIEPGFAATVEDALNAIGARASDFELELTEGLLIEPSPPILASLHALRSMGFTITIDDFGSGHASFRYLRDFPVDKVKLDQVFVRKLVLESADALIIRAVISLARSMGIGFVAEGIETEPQRDFLHQEGCPIGQGYFFSMPLVAEDFTWMLANKLRLPLRGPAQYPPAERGEETREDTRMREDLGMREELGAETA